MFIYFGFIGIPNFFKYEQSQSHIVCNMIFSRRKLTYLIKADIQRNIKQAS